MKDPTIGYVGFLALAIGGETMAGAMDGREECENFHSCLLHKIRANYFFIYMQVTLTIIFHGECFQCKAIAPMACRRVFEMSCLSLPP